MKVMYVLGAILISSVLCMTGCGTDMRDIKTSNEGKEVTANTVMMAEAKPKAELEEATRLLQINDYEKAIAKADEILEKHPHSDEAYSIKGMALGLAGHAERGLVFTKKAYELNPNNVANYYNMAMLYKLQGRLQEAKSWFEKVIAKDPHNTWSVYGIATIYADQGEDEKALAWLRQAVSLESEVKGIARTQDHFVRFHGNEAFEAIVK